ncbi:hypothetical protein ZWY2020_036969 [Hordeum vulgare]|nr:hypothetical protein ZWY2020_006844 [Hordeum vulgare]KAI4989652.1 hypothetical protein ZWY2020_036969 [Hordeum vulgare]
MEEPWRHDGWSASFDDPSYLQAAGRPSSFLPAMMLYGRQCCFTMIPMACCCRGIVGPSGPILGVSEIGVVKELLWTRYSFKFLFRVFFARFRDLFVISSSYWDLNCKMLYATTLTI